MKYGNLHDLDRRLRYVLSEDRFQLKHDSLFGSPRRIRLREDVEGELAVERFVFERLKIQQADGLLLELIHARGTAFGRGLEDRYRSRFYGELRLQVREDPSNHDCRWMWIYEI